MTVMTTTDAAVEERWVPEVDIATRLRLVRKEFGRQRGEAITQAEMAELLDVTKASYAQWEAGNTIPRDLVAVCKRIAEVTGVDVAWVLGVGPVDTQVTLPSSARTGSRWNEGFADGESDLPWVANASWDIPEACCRNVFWSIEDLVLAQHDGPKPLRDAQQRCGDPNESLGFVAVRVLPSKNRGGLVDAYTYPRGRKTTDRLAAA